MYFAYRCLIRATIILAPISTPGGAHADLITTQSGFPSPNLVDTFNNFDGSLATIGASHPVQVGTTAGENIVLSSTNGFVGQPEPFQLGSNGSWDPATKSAFAGMNTGNVNLTFTFNNGPVSQVGAFMNYGPGSGPDPVISAINSSGQVLESYDLATLAAISTPGQTNGGAFRGISRPQADIAAFEVSNSFLVLDDLQFTRAVVAVPESGTCILTCVGAASICFLAFRSRIRLATC